MKDITEDQQYALLSDTATGSSAPMALWRPMQRLAGGAERVQLAACSGIGLGDRTEWKVLWLTENGLVYGHAAKSQASFWSATSLEQSCDELEVWTRDLRQIRSVVASEVSVFGGDEAPWRWTEAYSVNFADGSSLSLPLHPNHPAGTGALSTSHELLEALVARL